MGENEIKRLIDDLAQAEALFDVKPAHADTLALMAVIRFLDSLGLPSSPLYRIAAGMFNAVLKQHHGGAIKDVLETHALAKAAAEVTKQVEAGTSTKDAIKDVCGRAGLDQDKVRKFRDNVSRGRVSEFGRGLYEYLLGGM